jgi:signal transduction histidine kinase
VLAKGEFLATMSHEIRTPLNGILPMLELIARGPLAPDQREMLATASQSRSSCCASSTTSSTTPAGSQALELEITSFNLRDLLDGVVQLMARRPSARACRWSCTGPRRAPAGARRPGAPAPGVEQPAGQRDQVHRTRGVVVACPPGRRCRHQLRFEIIDTGIGIGRAAGAPVPVLQPGRCLTTRIYGGTGLGWPSASASST